MSTGYTDVLKSAQDLPVDDQMELVETLLHNLGLTLQKQAKQPNPEVSTQETSLVSLIGLSRRELELLAEAVVAPNRQNQMQELLAKNRSQNLSAHEETLLDTLLDEADEVALLKARALYTLKLFDISESEEEG